MTRPFFLNILNRLKCLISGDSATSSVLRGFIREDEGTVGYDRNDVRARAKTWLITHEEILVTRDIRLARDHFGYMLPASWGT